MRVFRTETGFSGIIRLHLLVSCKGTPFKLENDRGRKLRDSILTFTRLITVLNFSYDNH
jgi:hypothetical protein